MNSVKYYKNKWFFILAISLLTLTKCAKIDEISLGSIQDELFVNNIDTFQVEVSTFLLDPLPTAATGSVMLGVYNDEYLGSTKMQSFFKVGMPELETEYEQNIQFDSISMCLKYNGYFYGDTTKAMEISLHQLTENIEKRKLPIALEGDEYPLFVSADALFADQSFSYESTALASVKFNPKPKSSNDSVLLKLNQEFGKELFNLAITKDAKLTNSDEFQEYLKGFVLKSNDDAASVIGFKDSISLILHYSHEDQSNGERISEEIKLDLSESDYQFNAVSTNRTGTILNALNYQNNKLDASQTNGRTFIQASTGIVTRLKFPTIHNSISDGTISINQAILYIETDQQNTLSPPIDTLVILKANKYGTPTSLLTNLSGTTAAAAYYQNINASSKINGKYAFDLTDYISNMLKSKTYDDSESLIIAPQIADLLSKMETLHIATEDNKPAIKLNVTYTKTQ